jgi:amino acid transporter
VDRPCGNVPDVQLDAGASAVSTDRPQAAIDQVLTDGDNTGEVESTQLRRNSVGLSGVTGQSLSAMGLSGVIGTSVPVVAILAGAGGWLTWAIAAVIIMFVALSISVLARRFATTGGLYGLAAKALGPLGGLVTGWLMVALIGVAASASVLSFGVYFSQFLSLFHVAYGRPTLLITSVAALIICWNLSRVGARLAAWAMFVTEIVATLALFVVFIALIVNHRGPIIDTQQLHLHNVSLSVVLTAVVLGVGGFGGFESAAVYGQEATKPRRVIPTAMVLSVAIAGVVWMFSSYMLFFGFQDSTQSLAKSSAPMGTLAQIAGIGSYRYVVDAALAFTIGASLIAAFSWVARMMLTMSREGIAPQSWKRIHPRYHTPARALGIAGGVWLVLVVLMGATSSTPLSTYGELAGDLSGYPLLLVYGLICVAAIAYQWRHGHRYSAFVLIAALGAGSMVYVMYRSLVPWPPLPDSIVVGAFLAITIAIVVVYLILRPRRPSWLRRIGSSVDDDTAALSD